MILISAHQIEKGFAGRTLFRGVSFGVEDGDRVGLIGPNGAGKSTLLKLLAGIAQPDQGTIARKKGLRLGFVEQTPVFAPQATVLSALLERCSDRDAALAKAYEIMALLELGRFGEDHPVDRLSGGWQKRVALARELVGEPELLLLDEPTNHLDVSAILWLEKFLTNAPFAVLMITHDRLFLQRVATRILDLDPRNSNHLLSVDGDYARYLETKELELHAQQRREQVEKNRLRRETEWLRRGAIARQTKQSARIQNAEALQETVEELTIRNRKQISDLDFGQVERSPQKLIEARGLSKSYGGRALFRDVDLLITPKTRLAILGDNGCGKSTLIKTLIGEISPDTGSVVRADRLRIAYFEQSRETLKPELSVLKNLCPEGDYVHFKGQFVHVRSYLDRFLFSGPKAELPVAKLSGGEQARLRLAQLMLTPAQVLILDEPTNDLDAETLDVLEESLRDFNGAVVLVSHDRYFLDAVCDRILAFAPEPVTEGRLENFAGYFQWESWFQTLTLTSATRPKPAADGPSPASGATRKAKLSYKEKYELENMEAAILNLESEIASLTEASQSPDTTSDHKKLAEILSRLANLQAELDEKFRRWAELESK